MSRVCTIVMLCCCLVSAAACYSPEISACEVRCSEAEGGDCPEGTACAGGYCNPPGVEASSCMEVDAGPGAGDAGDGSDAGGIGDTTGMVLIPSEDIFYQGCALNDGDCEPNEDFRRLATLSSYYIDITEVTQSAYAECVGAQVCIKPTATRYHPDTTPQWPVLGVSRPMAAIYCNWQDMKRLPTEAEWEKAARGTNQENIFPWGTPLPGCYVRAQYKLGAPCQFRDDPTDVGTFPMGNSDYGVKDMSGNVWEWVSDWYEPYSSTADVMDPTGLKIEEEDVAADQAGVLRGGGYATGLTESLRVSNRYAVVYSDVKGTYGMRCAKSVAQ